MCHITNADRNAHYEKRALTKRELLDVFVLISNCIYLQSYSPHVIVHMKQRKFADVCGNLTSIMF